MLIKNDFPLSQILWYKIGGVAKYVLEISSKEDVAEALDFVKKNNLSKYFVCATGTNVLFTDEYYDGAVLHIIEPKTSSLKVIDDTHIEAFAGEKLDSVLQFALSHNLIGLEWAGGLPGTVGAAIRGNVGAFGGEIKDVTVSSEVISPKDSTLQIYSKDQLDFSYRSSRVKKEKSIVVSAVFQLKKGTASEVEKAKEVYQANIVYRKTHHPLEYPNTGSVFKNIKEKENVEKVLQVEPALQEKVTNSWHGKVSMGYVIGKLGLTGFQVGHAQISTKHQNFIVNVGGATFLDVITIIKTVQKKVEEKFGFIPEVEVEIVE